MNEKGTGNLFVTVEANDKYENFNGYGSSMKLRRVVD